MDPEMDARHLKGQKKREVKKNRGKPPVWRRVLLWSARATLVVLAIGFSFSLSLFLSRSRIFVLDEVQIVGSQHLDAVQMRAELEREFPQNLFLIRPERVRQFVEAQPWVEYCQVRRVFPDTLKILIVERQPVALAKIENELFLADRRGVILESYGARFGHLDLAVVRGLENSTLENVAASNRDKMEVVMRVLQDLDSGDARLSDQISEIDISDPGRVALVPEDPPIRVYIGDSKYRERYQKYLSRLSMMDELTRKYGAMDSVDLSVEHRIIFHTKMGTASNVSIKDEADQGKG